jgi:WG containing repeat
MPLCASLIALCILFVSAGPARADSGLPMLLIVWPSAWLLLLAIIPIEAAVAIRVLKVGWKKSLVIVTIANLVSTIVGIPVTWFLMLLPEFVGAGRAFGLHSIINRVLSVSLQSAWLVPYESDLSWMVPAAAAVLCVPFFFMSVVVESLCARRFVSKESRSAVWRWSWIGNGITYGCIVIGLLGNLGYVLQTHFSEKFGYITKAGNTFALPADVEEHGYFYNERAAIRVAKKWGYVDKTGKCVIPTQFDKAEKFSDNRAEVVVNKKLSFIDIHGKIVASQQSFVMTKPFSESLAPVCVEDKWGFIDTDGKLVIQTQFDGARNFSEGLAAVRSGKSWGYIRSDGNTAITSQYREAEDFSDGLALVELADHRYQYIDSVGKAAFTIAEPHYHAKQFCEGLAVIQPIFGLSEYVDKFGQIRIQPNFNSAQTFSEGLACVSVGAKNEFGSKEIDLESSSGYGYIDKTGHFVIAPKFESAESFSEGLAAVKVGDRWGFINKAGSMVIRPQFSRVGSFSDGLAAVGERWEIDVP